MASKSHIQFVIDVYEDNPITSSAIINYNGDEGKIVYRGVNLHYSISRGFDKDKLEPTGEMFLELSFKGKHDSFDRLKADDSIV